jgi:hypothetical protein
MTLRSAIVLLVLLMLAAPAHQAGAQGLPSGKQLPAVSFTAPDGADISGDPQEWMLKPEYRKHLNKQMLRLTRAQDGPLRGMGGFWPARQQVERFFEMGPGYAYAAITEEDAIYLSYGRLFLASRGEPLYDPSEHTPFATPSLEGFAISPDGTALAVTVADGGTEIAIVQFIDLATGEVLPHQAGPVVVGGDMGFNWLDETTGLFRKTATTDLVEGDPSHGAAWTLFDLTTGREGPAVFGPTARGVKADFGDWFGLWIPAESRVAMGYLWRGNFIDAYVADLAAVRSGQPEWREVGEKLLLTDAEVWNGQFVFTATDALGTSAIFAQPLEGGPLRRIATGQDDLTYLFTTSLGETAYVAARRGDTHRLYRLKGRSPRLEPVALPFTGEIDFDSVFEVEGSPGSITFDMSASDRPWRLMRLDREGPAYPVDIPGLTPRAGDAALEGFHTRRSHAVSRDGTRVPMALVSSIRQEGPAPAIIHVYGSYGETTMAGWDPAALAWASLGGLHAECHVRGSGYYGPSWHAGGSGPDKGRAHQDMIACAEQLVRDGLAEPGRIAALGGSAGGLIAGPVALKRPDLFGAAIVEFGVVNPLRSLDGPNGATQIDEFGDPRRPEDAALMAASDSVELARTAVDVPGLFLCVGFQDSRVPHWMSARLAGVLAERGFGDRVVIHADADAGHSCGFYAEDQRDALAKQYAWLLVRFSD